MAQKYINIPVKPHVYEDVKSIAKSNNRGLGDQVEAWVARDLPTCEHKKQPVSIEIFPNGANLTGKMSLRKGWYCPTCNRVYQYEAVTMPEMPTSKQVQTEAVQS